MDLISGNRSLHRTAGLGLCLAVLLGGIPVGAAVSGAATKLPASTTPLSTTQAAAVATRLLGPLKPVSGSTTRGINGKTITLAGLASETANGVPELAGICNGAEARLARANRQGGVRGYKINYAGCVDDGASAQTAHQLVQADVDQKHVFAIVPMSSAVTTTSDGTFLNQNHVPYFGFGLSPAYCGWNSAAFAFSSMMSAGCTLPGNRQFLSSFSLAVYLAYKKAKRPSDVKWAFPGTNTPGSHAISNAQVSIAKSLGNKVVYQSFPDPGPGQPPLSNWAPVANQIIASGATVVLNDIAGASSLSLVEALTSQGYRGDIEGVGLDSPILLNIPSLANQVDGTLAESAWVGSSAFPSKQLNQVTADLKAIHSTYTVNTFSVLWGYQSADFFLQALAKTTGPLTTEKLANVINRGFTYSGYGTATGPSYWPQGHATQSNFVALARINAKTKSTTALLPIGQFGANFLVPSS